MFDSKKIEITSTNVKEMEDEVVLTIYSNDLSDLAGKDYSNGAFEGDESTKDELMPNGFKEGNGKYFIWYYMIGHLKDLIISKCFIQF